MTDVTMLFGPPRWGSVMWIRFPGPTLRLGQAVFGMARWAEIQRTGFGHDASLESDRYVQEKSNEDRSHALILPAISSCGPSTHASIPVDGAFCETRPLKCSKQEKVLAL